MGGSVADGSRFRRARMNRCVHTNLLSTVNAGLERLVCEDCGHVSVRFFAEAVKVYNDHSVVRRRPLCGDCGKLAVFMVPAGFACAKHAWDAASDQDSLDVEFWIPIKIDEASNATG